MDGKQINGWKWIDGWVIGMVNRYMNGNGSIDVKMTDGQMHKWRNGLWIDGWVNGWVLLDRQMVQWFDGGWMNDGSMDGGNMDRSTVGRCIDEWINGSIVGD